MRGLHWGTAEGEGRQDLRNGFTIWKAMRSGALTDAFLSEMTKDDIIMEL